MTETANQTFVQSAPFPYELEKLVSQCRYRPNWSVWLQRRDRGQGSLGLTLIIQSWGYDSYHPERGESYQVSHYFIVPTASYNRRTWQRWLFEQFRLVETHEAMEFFQIGDERPFKPSHGDGNDPYTVREVGPVEDYQT